MTDHYVVVLEKGARSYGAYIPDLPGCIATGNSIGETVTRISEAMALHLEAMRRDGDTIPPPTTRLTEAHLHLTEDAVGIIEVVAATALAA